MANLPARPPQGLAPLPPGWTEHQAPTGHTYYYHKEAKKSTYVRPVAEPQYFHNPLAAIPLITGSPSTAFNYNQSNAFSENNFGPLSHQNNFRGGNRGSHSGVHSNFPNRLRRTDDRPKHCYDVPNCAPWVLVKTKLGRRFVWNKNTNESFWKIPQEVMKGVVEFDRLEREKRERRERGEPSDDEDMVEIERELAEAEAEAVKRAKTAGEEGAEEGLEEDSEYEEVEITDDEGENDTDYPAKRQHTEESLEDHPLELGEDDIAWQLAAMEDMEGMEEDYPEEEEELTEGDCKALFKDLLDDTKVSPYSTWDKVLDDGILFDDERYKALPNMKSRKECWDEWCRERIQHLKEQREKQVKRDPMIPYMAFLQKYATPKLFWPEFKRKYRKEPEMKDVKLSDKEREKSYREHINRLKLPSSVLKSDISALLKAQTLSNLNRSTTLDTLPDAIITDIRFISLPSKLRDPLIETFISTLPPAPEVGGLAAEEEQEMKKRRIERDKREKALKEREKRVESEKKKQRRELDYGKGRLRREEEDLKRAMKVSNEGLKGQLGDLEDTEKGA